MVKTDSIWHVNESKQAFIFVVLMLIVTVFLTKMTLNYQF